MSPNTRTRRWLGGPLHPLQPDTPQAHPTFIHPPFQAWWTIRHCSQFPEVIPNSRAGYPRVTERYAELMLRLACLNRTPIAVASGRINRISCEISRSFRSLLLSLAGSLSKLTRLHYFLCTLALASCNLWFLLNHEPRSRPHLFGPFRQMGVFIVLGLRTQRQA